MNEQVEQICDGVAARLREILPPVLKELFLVSLKARTDEHRAARGRGIDARVEQLGELVRVARDVERALGNAQADAAQLGEAVAAIASQAFHAERSLRDAVGWARELTDPGEEPR